VLAASRRGQPWFDARSAVLSGREYGKMTTSANAKPGNGTLAAFFNIPDMASSDSPKICHGLIIKQFRMNNHEF